MDKKHIEELVQQDLISSEQAEQIYSYYDSKPKADNLSRALTIFSVIGSALVGLGIILIVAHNWDSISRPIKLFLAFLPTIIGQIACFYTLFKKKEKAAWREGSATFLIFAIGATISLVAQIYNISGDFPAFMLTWILLSLPLVYILPSSMAALLSLLGITIFCYSTDGYLGRTSWAQQWFYWPLLLGLVPHYYGLIQKEEQGGLRSNFTNFLHVGIPLSLICCLPLFFEENYVYIPIAYILLGSIFMVFGKAWARIYVIVGAIGTLICLFILSYADNWDAMQRHLSDFDPIAIVLLLLMILILVYGFFRKKIEFSAQRPLEYVFAPVLLLVFLSHTLPSEFAATFVNVLLIGIGIFYLRQGLANQDLQRMNLGLLTLIILITLRFFDLDISYAFRGVLFVLMGIAFFAANYFLIKNRKTES